MNASTSDRKRPIFKVIIVLVLAAALVAAFRFFDVQQLFRDALAFISDLGPLGPLLFIGLYIAACVFLLPGAILTLGAGDGNMVGQWVLDGLREAFNRS